MATLPSRRLRPDELEQDSSILDAVSEFTDYSSLNPNYRLETVGALREEMRRMRQEEARVERLLDIARDNARAAEWAYHSAILGVKQQVIAQYGSDSNEMQAIGLIRKSERRRPTRRKLPSLT